MTRGLVIIHMLLAFLLGCDSGSGDSAATNLVNEKTKDISSENSKDKEPDPYRQVFDDMVEVWTQMRDILAEVQDLPSAEQAALKMRVTIDRGYEVLVRAEQLPLPSKEKADALLKEYMPLKEDLLEMYEHHLFRIGRMDEAILDTVGAELHEAKILPDVEWTYSD